MALDENMIIFPDKENADPAGMDASYNLGNNKDTYAVRAKSTGSSLVQVTKFEDPCKSEAIGNHNVCAENGESVADIQITATADNQDTSDTNSSKQCHHRQSNIVENLSGAGETYDTSIYLHSDKPDADPCNRHKEITSSCNLPELPASEQFVFQQSNQAPTMMEKVECMCNSIADSQKSEKSHDSNFTEAAKIEAIDGNLQNHGCAGDEGHGFSCQSPNDNDKNSTLIYEDEGVTAGIKESGDRIIVTELNETQITITNDVKSANEQKPKKESNEDTVADGIQVDKKHQSVTRTDSEKFQVESMAAENSTEQIPESDHAFMDDKTEASFDDGEEEFMFDKRLPSPVSFSCPLPNSWNDHSEDDDFDFQQLTMNPEPNSLKALKELSSSVDEELSISEFDEQDQQQHHQQEEAQIQTTQKRRRPLCNLFAEDSDSEVDEQTHQKHPPPQQKQQSSRATRVNIIKDKPKLKSYFKLCMCLPAVQ